MISDPVLCNYRQKGASSMISPRPGILERVTATALMLLALFAAPAGQAMEEYRLGPQDRLRLKIFEWRASKDIIFEWTALNDEFTVGADGFLSLPFVGPVKASGQQTVELSQEIADLLVHAMGLGLAPDVAVEVVQFRPFYITGHVMAPGEFAFRPGLTVLQAVSIAGGLRTVRDDQERYERELIGGRGEVSLLAVTRISLLAKKARLEAELADTDSIEFPEALQQWRIDSTGTIFMKQEADIFEARRAGLSAQLRALSDLRVFLEREAESLQKQVELLDQQIGSLETELADVAALVEKGLAVAPRRMALERSLLQIRSDRVQAETGLLRARQDISRTDLSILELRSSRETEVASLLREVQSELNEINRRTDTAILLLRESEDSAPTHLMSLQGTTRPPRYSIMRTTSTGTVVIEADETTGLLPGDTLKVEILPLRTGPAQVSATPASAVRRNTPLYQDTRTGEGLAGVAVASD